MKGKNQRRIRVGNICEIVFPIHSTRFALHLDKPHLPFPMPRTLNPVVGHPGHPPPYVCPRDSSDLSWQSRITVAYIISTLPVVLTRQGRGDWVHRGKAIDTVGRLPEFRKVLRPRICKLSAVPSASMACRRCCGFQLVTRESRVEFVLRNNGGRLSRNPRVSLNMGPIKNDLVPFIITKAP